MYNAVYAETLKLCRHRATWLMVWIYPIAVAILNIAIIGRGLFGWTAADRALIAPEWIARSTFAWNIPMGFWGRWLIAGFAAVGFAGEYGWNTWKLVIPARERWQLIVAKWIVVVALLYAALLMADLIMLGGALLSPFIGGAAIPAGVTARAVLGAHAAGFANAAFPIVYTVAWAGFLGILTRSTLATAITSIVIIALEHYHGGLAMLASGWSTSITRIALDILPFYHSANVVLYLQSSVPQHLPQQILLHDRSWFSTSWETSSLVMMVWIIALVVLTLVRFKRQDMN